jgi:hypothetical protein
MRRSEYVFTVPATGLELLDAHVKRGKDIVEGLPDAACHRAAAANEHLAAVFDQLAHVIGIIGQPILYARTICYT